MSLTRQPEHSAAPAFDQLRRRLTGALALPGEELYTRLSTPWNVAVRTRPAAVVEARDAQDIVEAVRYAARAGLTVAVQSTGHGAAVDHDGALLIHTGRLDECVVYADGWARVGAGVRWRQVLDAAAVHGLAPLCGSSPGVGVVGYTTGGGVSPLARIFGAASDLVRAIEVVTGDGMLRRVTARQEPGLFWGLRGGKGRLGIVTAMEFDLLPVSQVYGGAVYFDGADARTVAHAWREWSAALPEQASTSMAFLRLPPHPGVPEALAGRLSVAIRFVWVGEPDAGAAVLAPLRQAATPIIDGVRPIPFTEIGSVHADPVDPMPVYMNTDLLRELPAAAVDALVDVAGPDAPSPQVVVELRQLGGAFARQGREPSALCHRDAAFSLVTIGVPVPPPAGATVREHAQAVRTALGPWATGGALPNFGDDGEPDRLARVYDTATVARLAELARVYDPAGVVWSA